MVFQHQDYLENIYSGYLKKEILLYLSINFVVNANDQRENILNIIMKLQMGLIQDIPMKTHTMDHFYADLFLEIVVISVVLREDYAQVI